MATSNDDPAPALSAERRELARRAGLLMKAVALLVDAGRVDASWEIYAEAFPGATQDDWRVLVALELGRAGS